MPLARNRTRDMGNPAQWSHQSFRMRVARLLL